MTEYNLEYKGVVCTAVDWLSEPRKFYLKWNSNTYCYEPYGYISEHSDTDHIRRVIDEFLKRKTVEVSPVVLRQLYEAVYALSDMVNQFGYETAFRRQEAVCDGGLSALECAFSALQDCGCIINSNGTITRKNLFNFQDKIKQFIERTEEE